ncbi:hypothetical protein SSPIM334S_06305 [Streptomyces spiroverticillatus]|nr:hypothetical protein [Streptomyces finlayi]
MSEHLNVIATRIFEAGEEREIVVTFGAPLPVGEDEWVCTYRISGLTRPDGQPLSSSSEGGESHGHDGVQAIRGALTMANATLVNARTKWGVPLTFLGQQDLMLE